MWNDNNLSRVVYKDVKLPVVALKASKEVRKVGVATSFSVYSCTNAIFVGGSAVSNFLVVEKIFWNAIPCIHPKLRRL